MAKPKFPKTVLVTVEKDGDDIHYPTHLNPQEIANVMDNTIKPIKVATYKLVSIDKLNFLPNWEKVQKVE